MTSREIVRLNLTHGGAQRPGFDFDGGRRQDILWATLSPSRRWAQRRWREGDFEYYDDAWGNVWHRKPNMSEVGEVCQPVLKDWRRLDTFVLPDFDDPARYAAMAAFFREDRQEHFRMVFLPLWIFAVCRYLRKMEIYLIDLIEYPEEIDRLHARVAALTERVLRRCAAAGADGVFFCEDWGVQDRPLVSLQMFRERFAPHYRRLTAAAHECGLKVVMHSCGNNTQLLEDFAETGLDGFQFDQPAVYDMPALAAFLRKKKIGLHAPLDIQRVLPTGDRALIEREARRMVDLFRGGLILKNYPDLKGIGVKPEWDQWAYEAFLAAAGPGL